MRTTIILPDGLYEQVKDTARAADETVTSLVEEALRRELDRRAAVATRPRVVLLAPFDGGVDGGIRPGLDIADNAGLLAAMDDALPVVKRR